MEPLNPETRAELEELLLCLWPEGTVSRQRLFWDLGLDSPLDQAVLLSELGLRECFPVGEVARVLWERSNHADFEA